MLTQKKAPVFLLSNSPKTFYVHVRIKRIHVCGTRVVLLHNLFETTPEKTTIFVIVGIVTGVTYFNKGQLCLKQCYID